MYISIDGIDGTGKTTVAKALAKKLGFYFVEKPFSGVFSDQTKEKYLDIKNGLKKLGSKNASCWFYGMNLIFASEFYRKNNIVVDRGLVSNFAWMIDLENIEIFDTAIKFSGLPDFTVLITLANDIIKQRLFERDGEGGDSYKIDYMDSLQNKMISLLDRCNAKYVVLDRTNLDVDETIEKIVLELKKRDVI